MMLGNVTAVHRPRDLQEALRLVRQPGTVPLGGGTRLLPGGDPDVTALVDLSRLGLGYVEGELERVRLGAAVTIQQLADAPEAQELTQGLVAEAARLVAARNLRAQATLGGMVVAGGAEHPLLTLLLALGASVVMYAPEKRTVSLDSFLGYRSRVSNEGLLVIELLLPRVFGQAGLGFAHVERTPGDRPIVCAAAQVVLEQGRCRDVRLALGGVAERPVCMPRAMQRLRGSELATSSLDEAAAQAASSLSPRGDFRGSGEYRQEMAAVLARRALSQAASHAKGKQ